MTFDQDGSAPAHIETTLTEAPVKGQLARRNLITAAAHRGASVISAFIRIPLLLHTLGPDQYGLWLGIFAAAGLSTISDFGLQLSVTQRVAELRGAGKTDEVRPVVATAFWLSMAGFAILTTLTVGAVAIFSPFAHDASAAGIDTGDVRTLLLLACLASFALQPLKILFAAQYGFERMYALNVCEVAGIIVNVAGLWLLTGIVGDSLIVLGAWTVLWDLGLGATVAVLLVRRHREYLSIAPRDVRRSQVRPLFRQAAAFFFGTVANSLRWSLDSMIILAILGPTFVPRYEPSIRLFLAGLTIVHLVFGTLWPSFTESAARHDWPWVNRVFRGAALSVLAVAGILFMLTLLFGRDLLLRWVGPAGYSSETVLLTLGLWFVVSAWVLIAAHLTISLGGAVTVMRWGLAEGVLNIGLTLVLAHVWGLAGVALASLIAVVVFGAAPLTLRLRALTESRVELPVREMRRLACILGAGIAVAFLFRRSASSVLSLPALVLGVLVAGTVMAAMMWFVVIGPAERRSLLYQVRSTVGRSRQPAA